MQRSCLIWPKGKKDRSEEYPACRSAAVFQPQLAPGTQCGIAARLQKNEGQTPKGGQPGLRLFPDAAEGGRLKSCYSATISFDCHDTGSFDLRTTLLGAARHMACTMASVGSSRST